MEAGNLLQTLLKSNLVDEFRLKICPVILAGGKRLFGEGSIPANFKLVKTDISPKGVIIANCARARNVKIGSFGTRSG